MALRLDPAYRKLYFPVAAARPSRAAREPQPVHPTCTAEGKDLCGQGMQAAAGIGLWAGREQCLGVRCIGRVGETLVSWSSDRAGLGPGQSHDSLLVCSCNGCGFHRQVEAPSRALIH